MAKRRTHIDREKAPLDRARLNDLAVSYVARFATTRAKLTRYLDRKLREQGWDDGQNEESAAAACEAIAKRLADLGYIDDQQYAEMRGRSMTGRGLGLQRVKAQLWVDGIAADDAEAAVNAASEAAPAAAIHFARKRRLGPFAQVEPSDPALRQRQLAAFLRAGHAMELARRILAMAPGDEAGLAALDAAVMLD